jgi:heme exporter protein C
MSTLTAQANTRSKGWGVGDMAQMLLNILAMAGMAGLMYAALVFAKPATNLAGDEQIAQRIFYLHIGCNIGTAVGYLVSVIASIGYLITRKLDWDRVTQAGIEIGTIFGLSVILSGSIWAKPTWNTYWTWDPRLTTSTITVLVYIAYLLFRNGIDNRHTRARFGSIYALVAFLSVPLTYYSARWFRSIHPIVSNGRNADAQGGFQVGASMGQTLMIATFAFALLFGTLLIQRLRQLRLEDRVEALREELE